MGTPSEGPPHPLFLSSTPLEGKETANSVWWPVEFWTELHGSINQLNLHKTAFFSLRGEVDLIKPGDTDPPAGPQQVCCSIRGVCERKKSIVILRWLLFLQRLRKFSKISSLT